MAAALDSKNISRANITELLQGMYQHFPVFTLSNAE